MHLNNRRKNGGKILFIDDEVQILQLFTMLFRNGNYTIKTANSPQIGFEIIRHFNPHMIVLDYNMPEFTGDELITKIKKETGNNAFIIVISGSHEQEIELACLKAGANFFLKKPLHLPTFQVLIENNITRVIRNDPQRIAKTILRALHYRDCWSGRHSHRVAKLSLLLSEKIGLNDKEKYRIETAAKYHDIGKIGIPDEILLKKSQLTELEYREIQSHPEKSIEILIKVSLHPSIPNAILHHHERWDGNGYPKGLYRDEISFEGRILAIVDSCDAILHERPYKPAYSIEWMREELQRGSGNRYDPDLIKHFLAIPVEKIQAVYQ